MGRSEPSMNIVASGVASARRSTSSQMVRASVIVVAVAISLLRSSFRALSLPAWRVGQPAPKPRDKPREAVRSIRVGVGGDVAEPKELDGDRRHERRDRRRDTRLVVMGIAAVLLVWFAVGNLQTVEIHFWVHSTKAPVIVVVAIAVALGAVIFM